MKLCRICAKILAVVLIVSLSSLALFACNDEQTEETPKNTKAIIYVTALFSGGLYDSNTNQAVWEPFPGDIDPYAFADENGAFDFEAIIEEIDKQSPGFLKEALSLVLKVLGYKPGTLLYDLSLDADGNSNNPAIIPANDKEGEMDIYYGVFGIYRLIINKLKERYANQGYDIKMFNYDWRYSPADGGAKLEEYINDAGYEEVIILSQSMGGPVTNSYLARSQSNRDKVKLYLSYCPATLGSFDALAALSDPLGYMEGMLGGFNLDAETMETVKSIAADSIDKIKPFLTNNQGLIALVPSWEFLNSEQYDKNAGEAGIVIDGVAIDSKEELYNYYKSCEWAYYGYDTAADDWIRYGDGSIKIKDVVLGLEDYYDSYFINGEYVSDLVNTYYLVGTGLRHTITGMTYDSELDEYTIVKGHGNNRYGDGTVPYYSSLGGQKESDIPDGHIIRYENHSHIECGAYWDIMEEDCYRLIDSVFNK